MRTQLCLTVTSLAILSLPSVSQAQLENTDVGRYFKAQGMIALPTSWQPYIGPGSAIYVDWQPVVPGKRWLGYRFRGKSLDNAPTDLPASPENQTATALAKQHLSGTSLDISLSLGKFSPELRIGRGSRIDYPQTTFSVKGWGPDAHKVNAALRAATLSGNFTDGTYDAVVNGQRLFKGYGQGYLVTSVFTVEDLVVTVTNTTQLEASLKDLATGQCTAEIPASQFPDPPAPAKVGGPSPPATNPPATPNVHQPTPATPTTPTTPTSQNPATSKDAGGATPDAKTTLPTVPGLLSNATVKICHKTDTQYSMKVSPGVPIAFTATEIHYNAQNKPEAYVQGKLQDLRDAMKYPD